jgi:hypothetical protein
MECFVEYFASEDAFWKAFERYNALNGSGFRWETPTAAKEHVDLFGVVIKDNELYFRKQNSGNAYAAQKLSRSSMEKVLYLTVETVPLLESLSKRALAREQQEFADMAAKLES